MSARKLGNKFYMSDVIRNSVKVILLNNKNELLLLCADDPKTTAVEGVYHGKFWFLTGGAIESNESIRETAFREIYEETGIARDEVNLGPVVWYGEFDLCLAGTPTRFKEKFIVATTSKTDISFVNLTAEEKEIIKSFSWFSLDQINNCPDVIYPVLLPEYLPNILVGKYPTVPMKIDLAKQPKVREV